MTTLTSPHRRLTPEAGPGRVDPATVTRLLRDGALSHDGDRCRHIAQDAIAMGLAPATIVDHCIGEAARQLGIMWTEDEAGFAQVTIGTARLQSVLRHLEQDLNILQPARGRAVVIVNPHGMQHTLGAATVATQMRRQGIAVSLMLDARPEDLRRLLSQSTSDAVFLAATSVQGLEILRSFADVVRNEAPDVPVVVGGLALCLTRFTRDQTGADHVTSDLDEALDLCGLRTMHDAPRAALI